MAQQLLVSHKLDRKNSADRVRAVGYNCWVQLRDGSRTREFSENIAARHRVQKWRHRSGAGAWPVDYEADSREMARGLVDQWMDSPGHRANMLKPSYRWIGIGAAVHTTEEYGYIVEKVYATQNFAMCWGT